MPTIPIHKGCQFYELWGPEGAPYVLILRGAFSGSWQYHLLRDHLATDLRVITVDYRGDGQSKNQLWDASPGQIAEDMCALVERLGAERCHVIAISMGVFVLAEMLHRGFPAAGRSIIVGAPALRGGLKLPMMPVELLNKPRDRKLTPTQQVALAITGLFVSERFRKEQPARCQEMVDHARDMSGTELWAGLQQFAGTFGYEWGRHRILERLDRGARLFMVGDQDILAPIENVRAHPLFLAGPTLVSRDAGHRFFYEDAQPFNDIAHHFLVNGGLPEPLPGGGLVQPLEVSA
jgi:pimeloyl-ACP methyl ester carboxylesterase